MSVARLGLLGLGMVAAAAHAAVPGRDFVPDDWAKSGSIEADGAANYTLLDAFAAGGDLWLLYVDPAVPGSLRIDRYDPTSGTSGALVGGPSTVLAPDTSVGSVEAHGLNSAQLGACAPVHMVGDPLVWDGRRYRTSHIGVIPESLSVVGGGGACARVGITHGSFMAGYENSGAYTTDGFGITRPGNCKSFAATYDYTTCGFSAASAYRCDVVPDPVPDADAELGACRYLLMYEADFDGDADPRSVDDRALLTAHARQLGGPWVRYLPSGSAFPTTADVRVQNTSEHAGDGAANLHSFVSVPTLWYDTNAALWRMWFVTEDARRPSIRYTESDDDGQSWGIGGGGGGPIDCWGGTAFDSAACTEIAWSGNTPPDDITAPDIRSPDSVDPEVVEGEFDGRVGLDLGMMFTGGDDACANGDWGVQLWQVHGDRGDQSGGQGWRWVTQVAADPIDGIVVDMDRTACTSAGLVMDPEIVRYRNGYLAFFNAKGGIHVAASGYACSNFRDDDASGTTDWPEDGDCTSPWDGGE